MRFIDLLDVTATQGGFKSEPLYAWPDRVYGGLLLAQSIMAASRTVSDDRAPHSIHARFLAPASPDEPIFYAASPTLDGRSFSVREVRAYQRDVLVFTGSVSLQRPRPGLDFAAIATDVPELDECVPYFSDEPTSVDSPYSEAGLPILVRTPSPAPFERAAHERIPTSTLQPVWMRVHDELPSGAAIHAAALAFLSDLTVADAVLAPHSRSVADGGLAMGSLDHTMWFHRPMPGDHWILCTHEVHATGGGRGLVSLRMHDDSGAIGASATQEVRVRPRS